MQRFPLGATHQELAASIASHCSAAVVHEYTPEQAAPFARQTQVNCHGYAFGGKPRKLELLINDGRLGFYWLMLDADEIETARAALATQLGPPACDTGRDLIFADASIALRRNPAEILVALPADFDAIVGVCP